MIKSRKFTLSDTIELPYFVEPGHLVHLMDCEFDELGSMREHPEKTFSNQ